MKLGKLARDGKVLLHVVKVDHFAVFRIEKTEHDTKIFKGLSAAPWSISRLERGHFQHPPKKFFSSTTPSSWPSESAYSNGPMEVEKLLNGML